MGDKERFEFLKQMHGEVRSEIQSRIHQRDNFAIQFIVTTGTVLTIAFLDFKYSPFLFFLLPILAIFFSVQILYSYTIHKRCHTFLTEEVEPELAKLLNYSEYYKDKIMWESYCKYDERLNFLKAPGIRQFFFEKAMFAVPIISSLLFFLLSFARKMFKVYLLLIITLTSLVVFEFVATLIIVKFKKKKYNEEKVYSSYSRIDYINNAVSYKKPQKAIFLDRDGTIHYDKVNTHRIEDLVFFEDTVVVLKRFQELGYMLVIVSNQDGIRKGIYNVEKMHEFNMKMMDDLAKKGIVINAIYYSPYCKSDNHFSFKPNPGMLLRAKYELNIDMEKSFFIGDQVSDVIAGARAGVRPILVKTGLYERNPEEEISYKEINPPTFGHLSECLNYIEQNEINQ